MQTITANYTLHYKYNLPA
uniref:Uncharacterized protein n=1 Tax=Rhizophora mucronata TaxID=61149 RepID=A0A2P2QKX9_RHIMU